MDANTDGKDEDPNRDEDLGQHRPLSPADEYLIHNHPNPVRVMWTTDPRAYERVWFAAHDQSGELMVVAGLAFYPNLDTAEAYVIVVHHGVATAVRAHRRLGLDRMNMTNGPFRFEIVRPFRQWRISLGNNDHGIELDLTWHDVARAVYDTAGPYVKPDGSQAGMTNGYESFGTVAGWVSVDGVRHELTHERTSGTRDHHWGVRDGVGGRGIYQGGRWPFSGFWVHFASGWGLWGHRILHDLGTPTAGATTLASLSHRFAFDAAGILIAGEADLVLPDGSTKHLSFERIGNQVAPLRLAMYPSPQGGTPEGDIWAGMYVADGVITGERHDINDPAVRAAVSGLDDVLCRIECDGESTVGLAEPYHPFAIEACRSAVGGFAMLGD